MRTVQDIVFGVAGQVLTFDAPEGRPTSVTSVEVFAWDAGDDDDAELATTGVPAVETNPNTTTDAAAGSSQADRRRVPLTATTGCAPDRRFLLTGADQVKEWIEVEDVDAADAVIARHPLFNDFASGSSFVSTRISVTVDTTWCSDDANLDVSAAPNPAYRVRWVYVVAGATYVADTYFNLVRYAGRHGVQPQDVELTYPGWLDRLPIDHRIDQGRRLIDEAFRAVKIDMHAVLIDDADVAESEIVDELVRYKAIDILEWSRFLAGSSGDDARSRAAADRYGQRFQSLVKLTIKTPVRDETGAAAAPVRPLSLSQR